MPGGPHFNSNNLNLDQNGSRRSSREMDHGQEVGWEGEDEEDVPGGPQVERVRGAAGVQPLGNWV